MNKLLFCFFFLMLGALAACVHVGNKDIAQEVGVQGTESITTEEVRLNELVSNIQQWDGSMVELQGYFIYDFEDVALYQSDNGVKSNAVWVDFDNKLRSKINLENYSGKQIRIKGRVSSKKGHLMQYAGTIDDVYYIALAEK